MTTRSLFRIRRHHWAITLATVLACAAGAHAQDDAKPTKPKTEGRPVYIAAGKVVVFPAGVEEPPKGYKGAIGARPLALITIDETIVGEVYASPLEGTPAEEAKGMAASADSTDKIELKKRTRIKKDDEDIEVVALRMKLESNLGTPWVIHSLYFPRKESSATFKLVASEEQFKAALPYFETMLFFGKDGSGK